MGKYHLVVMSIIRKGCGCDSVDVDGVSAQGVELVERFKSSSFDQPAGCGNGAANGEQELLPVYETNVRYNCTIDDILKNYMSSDFYMNVYRFN